MKFKLTLMASFTLIYKLVFAGTPGMSDVFIIYGTIFLFFLAILGIEIMIILFKKYKKRLMYYFKLIFQVH